MKTTVIKIEDIAKHTQDIERAAALIRDGGLVVIPTETVYGLGGDGTNPLSAQKIYAAKGRPSDNPLIIHISEPSEAEGYAYTNELYYKLARAFMPGPLTVILPKKDTVPLETTGGLDTVAIRCPSHPVANAIIKSAGVPIAAPSANISGKPSTTAVEYVIEDFDGRVDMIIDGGACEIGLESTIVLITKEGGLILLRPGAITYDALCCVVENVKIAPAVLQKLAENEKPLSPGMKYRHYAPNANFILLDGDKADVLDFIKKEQIENNCAVLCYDEELEVLCPSLSVSIGKENDLATQAKRLFTALREADKLGSNKIYAHLPKLDGLGLALYNRMIRAAAHTIKKV